MLAAGRLGLDACGGEAVGEGDATLGADDEIVFMAKDTGGRVPLAQAAPADVDASSRLELRVSDPVDAGNAGWVYLFRRTSGALSPGAGAARFQDSRGKRTKKSAAPTMAMPAAARPWRATWGVETRP